MYQEHGEKSGQKDAISNEEDPFWDAIEPLLIGFAPAFLQCLSYGLSYSDTLQVSDLDGAAIGKLDLQLQPCYQSGQPSNEDEFFVEDSKDLLGKPFFFKVCYNQ